MSLAEVDAAVKLELSDVFNHRPFLREEIENFRNAFERNDRFKEFDSLIKKNHKIYEANETSIIPLLQSTTLKALTEKMTATAKRLERLTKPRLRPGALGKVDLLTLTQTDIFKIAEKELKRPVDLMEKIIEME